MKIKATHRLITFLIAAALALILPVSSKQQFIARIATTQSSCVLPPFGLIGWWPGDGNPNDIQGINHGTLQNGATFEPGKVDQAFSLDGVDDFIGDIGMPASFSFIQNSGVFGIDAWIKIRTPNSLGIQTITENSNARTDKGHFFVFENRDGQKRLRMGLTNGSLVPVIDSTSPPGVIADTNWHHVAVTGDGTNITFYVDGTAYSGTGTMGSKSSGASTNLLRIGDDTAVDPNVIEPFDGLIDEVDIFNLTVLASEIRAIYNAGSAGKCQAPPNCARNATTQVDITRSAFRFNRGSQRYVQNVTVRNISGQTIQGPIALVLDNLSSNASLLPRTGLTFCSPPPNSPFIELSVGGDNQLSPGEITVVTLQFVNSPLHAGITYTTKILAESNFR